MVMKTKLEMISEILDFCHFSASSREINESRAMRKSSFLYVKSVYCRFSTDKQNARFYANLLCY